MKSFTKLCGVALAALIVFCAALPSGRAQTRTFSIVAPQNGSGAYLGINMDDVTADNLAKYKLNSERGVIVRSVMKGSPAEKANLRENDVILEFGGYPVWSSLQFSRLVRETPVGRKVDLNVSRDGKRINLSAQLAEREGERAENRAEERSPEDFFGRGDRSFNFRWPNMPEGGSAATQPKKPRLGLTLQPLTDQLGEFLGVPDKKGALVSSVAADSPSAGKLKSGDVIIGVDDKKIGAPEDLSEYVNSKAGGSIKFKIIRDKKEIAMTVDLPGKDDQKGYKL